MTRAAYVQSTAQWLRQERQRLGLTRAQVAAAAGVSEQSVGNWERGVGGMTAYSQARLRAFFRKRHSEAGAA